MKMRGSFFFSFSSFLIFFLFASLVLLLLPAQVSSNEIPTETEAAPSVTSAPAEPPVESVVKSSEDENSSSICGEPCGLYGAYVAIGVMAVIPIYAGSYRTLEKEKKPKHAGSKKEGEEEEEEEKEVEKERISSADAKMFPVYGSGVLFSLYLLFKYVSQYYVNLIMSAYFSLLGVASLVNFLHPLAASTLFKLHPRGSPFHVLFARGNERFIDIKFDWAHVALAVLGTGVSLYYALTKNWIVNNIFGETFSLGAIQLLHLDSFTTGMILLTGLFFYDIFWVFGTEVMVSVAKSFDAPIKVVFPKDIFAETLQFSMLGLGDIVIPGIFVALALRFDQSLSKDKKNFPKPYFTACFTAYCLGLITTITVMQVFKAAQPALLYLSPACILSVLITALIRGETKQLFAYSPEKEDPKIKGN